ncbi:MAG: M28 family peptidase [Gemmatimonadota bacterium]
MDPRIASLKARLKASGQADARAARDAVRALAVPRLAGTEAGDRVERWIRRRFERLGFETRLLPFAFSSLPGRYGWTLLAAGLAAASLASAWLLAGGRPFLSAGALLLPLAAAAYAARRASAWTSGLPWGRLEGRNMVFTRPGGTVRYLIAAHRDSKSQPTSTGARLRASALAALGWATLGLLAAHGAAGAAAAALGAWADGRLPATLLDAARELLGPALSWNPPPALLGVVAGVTAAAAAFVALSWAGNESPGALDNATGVVALLALAERLRDRQDVGYLVTDAEELALAGARAAAPEVTPLVGIINLDGLDDDGPVHVVERYGLPRRGRAPHLAAALLTAAAGLELDIQRHDAPRGILLEHSAYSDAGVPSLTVARGPRSALGRIHRPSDRAETIDGRGVASIVALIEGALHLLEDPHAPAPAPPLLPGRAHPSARDLRPAADPQRTPLFAHRPAEAPLPLAEDSDYG